MVWLCTYIEKEFFTEFLQRLPPHVDLSKDLEL